MANPDTSTPPPKRVKRSHSELASDKLSTGELRHRDFYFNDGNVVLLAEQTYFKVHKGVLSRHSSVFNDMFSTAQSSALETDQYDSCPLVRLSDPQADVEHILSAMYDGIKKPQPMPFSKLSAFLRLGHKYDIAGPKDEAIRCLREAFPRHSLEKFDKWFLPYLDVGLVDEPDFGRTPDFPLILRRQDLHQIIKLCQEYGLPDVKTLVLYVCSQLPWSTLADFLTQGVLTRKACENFIRGRDTSREMGARFTSSMLECFSCDDCKDKVPEIIPIHCDSPLTPFRIFSATKECREAGMCDDCFQEAESLYERMRERHWHILEDIFVAEDD